MFKTQYRVVIDGYSGFEVQSCRWWFPVWCECWGRYGPANTHASLERAKAFLEEKKSGAENVVYGPVS